MSKTNTNTKMNFIEISNKNQETKENNFNDTVTSSLKSRYKLINENLQVVLTELAAHKKEFAEFRGSQSNMKEIITQKGDQLKDNVEITIQRMDSEVQKSLSHQKAENSRLEQQINQLNADKTIIGNQLINLEKRINEIANHVGKML